MVWGRFHHLERTIYGTHQEVYYKLCGVERGETYADPTVETDGHSTHTVLCAALPPLQVILRGTSTLHVGVHVRMLQRSLNAIVFSLTGRTPSAADKVPHESTATGHKHPPVQHLPPAAHIALEKKTSTVSSVATVVPGAGAGELGWSLLWRQMARTLAKGLPGASTNMLHTPSDGFADKAEGDNTTTSLSFEDKIKPLVDFLSAALYQRVGATYPEGRSECAALCELLSDAYRQVPLQCVINAFDVLPDSCENSCNANTDGASNGLPLYANKRSPQSALLHWERCFSRAGAATGRVGLVVDPDPFAE